MSTIHPTAQGHGNFEGPRAGVALAVQKGQEDLVEELDKAISKLLEEGKIEEFYQGSIDLVSEQNQ